MSGYLNFDITYFDDDDAIMKAQSITYKHNLEE